jgi:hypothetical protein
LSCFNWTAEINILYVLWHLWERSFSEFSRASLAGSRTLKIPSAVLKAYKALFLVVWTLINSAIFFQLFFSDSNQNPSALVALWITQSLVAWDFYSTCSLSKFKISNSLDNQQGRQHKQRIKQHILFFFQRWF